MSDYTPTTEEMRAAWVYYKCMSECEECPKEFDRWLAEVKAKAWEEGYQAGLTDFASSMTNNPYRQGETDNV